MKNPSSVARQMRSSDLQLTNSFKQDEARQRRLLEIKRRFKGLQIRREHLENELQSVKNCLISLDRQMRYDASFKQLSMRN